MDQNPTRDPRVYLAVERTYLAWIRTGLSLMGFGFVVARFGLFLRELSATTGKPIAPYGISNRFGTALVITGVVLSAAAVIRYIRLLRRIDKGQELRAPSMLAITLGTGLALIGAAVAIWLLSVAP